MTKGLYEHPLSWRALFRIIAVGAGIYLTLRLFDTFILVVISMMLASAFYPIVYRLSKRIPLTFASIIVVLALFIPIFLLLFTFIPGLFQQFPEIINSVQRIVTESDILPEPVRNIDFGQYAENTANYVLQSTSRVTSFITTFFTVIFLTLYLLIDSRRLEKIILSIIPDDQEEKLRHLVNELARINGQYIRGNLIISIICGIFTYIGLLIIGIPFAGSLALFTAIVDLLPLIGAFIGAVPAVIIAFSISPTAGILTLLLYLVYQQIENNIISPNVYNRALDISPALSFIAVIVGTSLLGILGAFIALPIAASIPTVIKYIREDK